MASRIFAVKTLSCFLFSFGIVAQVPAFAAEPVVTSIKRVSVTSAGKEANSHSYEPEFSPDGKLVVFGSSADNLVPKDTNQRDDIFVKTLKTGVVRRISTTSTSAQADGSSSLPSFSPNGQQVVFVSRAKSLVSGKTNPGTGIFIKSLISGKVIAVSRNSAGTLVDYGDIRQVRFTANGKSVVFDTDADGLVPDDNNGLRDIFMQNIATGKISLISETKTGVNANDESTEFAVSPNGKYIAFSSIASNLVPNDKNGTYDIFVKNLVTKAVVRISRARGGGELDGNGKKPAFTADSRFVGYESDASKFAPNGPSNGNRQIVMSTVAGTFVRVISSNSAAKFGDGQSSDVNFSKDGRFATFSSEAFNLAPIEFDAKKVFIKNLVTGKVTLVTTNGPSVDSSFSANGKHIVFKCGRSLVTNDTNNVDDIYVANLR